MKTKYNFNLRELAFVYSLSFIPLAKEVFVTEKMQDIFETLNFALQ